MTSTVTLTYMYIQIYKTVITKVGKACIKEMESLHYMGIFWGEMMIKFYNKNHENSYKIISVTEQVQSDSLELMVTSLCSMTSCW